MNKIKLTVEDPETGDTETAEVMDDYVLVTAGSCYVDGAQRYGNGTTVITVKGCK